MRSSSPAPAFASPKPRRTWRRSWASRSRPPTTPWRGTCCASPASPSRCRNGAGCLPSEPRLLSAELEAADVLAAGHAFDMVDLGAGIFRHQTEVEGTDFRIGDRELMEDAVA